MEDSNRTRHSSQMSYITMEASYKRLAIQKATESSKVDKGDTGKQVLQRSDIPTKTSYKKMANQKRAESSRVGDGDAGKQILQRMRLPLLNDVDSGSNVQFSRMKDINEGNTLGVICRCLYYGNNRDKTLQNAFIARC